MALQWHALYKVLDNNFKHFMEVLSTGRFFRKMFCQLNNCYVVKQQYGPLNTMCFCSLQPHFLFLSTIKYCTTLTKVC